MKFDPSLYLVTNSEGLDEASFLKKIDQACQGGVSLVQLREKTKSDRAYLDLAWKVKEITDHHQIPLIIDDRVDLAQILDCGVHLGQSDIPIKQARRLLKNNIIGASTKTLDQALEAERNGADYLGVGAIFPTKTKVKTRITSLNTLGEIATRVRLPVLAIGGLKLENCMDLKGIPLAGIALVSALMEADNPRLEARKLRLALEQLLK